MQLPVPVRRLGYRLAYAGLRGYWFLLRPSSRGVKCVLSDGDRVLLVRHTYGSSKWDLPGGGIRRGEQPAAAASREMEEELGLRIDDWHSLGEALVRSGGRDDRVYCFGAELEDPSITIDLGELSAAQWFPRRSPPPDLGRYARQILRRLA